MVTASARIASFAANFCEHPLAEEQHHLVYRAFLDLFSVAVAGRHEPAVRIARHYLRDTIGAGRATLWASGELAAPEMAAFFNGIAGHVLDYDDVMQPLRGHPSVALLPALVALAQSTGVDNKRLSAAYIAGFEVLAKISTVMANRHIAKGWHPTASLGVLGAVVACSVLLGLNEKQTCHAIGLAVAQAAGNRQNFGTMAKSFQVGQAGAAAVRAVLLAQSGFDAPLDALDGKYGYMALYGEKEDLTSALATLGHSPLAIDEVGLDVKKYPCCYATHRALDGVLELRAQHGLDLETIDSVNVVTSGRGLESLPYAVPRNELEAKFSMEYTVACALLDGRIRLASFSEEMVHRPALRAFLSRITKREGSGSELPRWAEVTLRLRNGKVLEQRITSSRGDAENPLSDTELMVKAEDCFSYGDVAWSAKKFAGLVLGTFPMAVDGILRKLPTQRIAEMPQ